MDGETIISRVIMTTTTIGIWTWIGNRIVQKLDEIEKHLYDLKIALARIEDERRR